MSTSNKKTNIKQTKNTVKAPNKKETIKIEKVLSESDSETDSDSDLEPESKPNNSKLKLQSKESESGENDSKPNNSKIKPKSQSKESESDESECDEFKSDESECDEFETKSKLNNDKLKSQEKESESEDTESEDTNSEESDDEVIKITKKKIKKNWEETSNEFKEIYLELKTCGIEMKKHIDGQVHCLKVHNEYMRKLKKTLDEINIAHVNGIKDNEAEKKKRKKKDNNNLSGIGKAHPVPDILSKYLGLSDGDEKSRIEISTLLHKKFHTDNLKNGQITTLDKNAAKLLGKEENREIKFGEVQTFIKEFYDEDDFHKKFENNNLNNKTAIPSKLVKYLNLGKDIQLSHFEISRLLLDKLYSKEQKDYNKEQKIKPKFFVLNKEMSNSLGIDINRKIEIAEFTTFFIEFYK